MTKKERYLITTSIQETWKFDQSVIFLGEWRRGCSTKHKTPYGKTWAP